MSLPSANNECSQLISIVIISCLKQEMRERMTHEKRTGFFSLFLVFFVCLFLDQPHSDTLSQLLKFHLSFLMGYSFFLLNHDVLGLIYKGFVSASHCAIHDYILISCWQIKWITLIHGKTAPVKTLCVLKHVNNHLFIRLMGAKGWPMSIGRASTCVLIPQINYFSTNLCTSWQKKSQNTKSLHMCCKVADQSGLAAPCPTQNKGGLIY